MVLRISCDPNKEPPPPNVSSAGIEIPDLDFYTACMACPALLSRRQNTDIPREG